MAQRMPHFPTRTKGLLEGMPCYNTQQEKHISMLQQERIFAFGLIILTK